jgi:hypothetical protein
MSVTYNVGFLLSSIIFTVFIKIKSVLIKLKNTNRANIINDLYKSKKIIVDLYCYLFVK